MQFSNQTPLRILSELGSAEQTVFVIQSEDPQHAWQQSAVNLYADKSQLQQFTVNDQRRISFAAGRQCGAKAQPFAYRVCSYSFPENGKEYVITLEHVPRGESYQYPLMQLVNDPQLMAQLSLHDTMNLAYYAAEWRLQEEKTLLAAARGVKSSLHSTTNSASTNGNITWLSEEKT